jgi:hypothetical protein
MVLIEDPEDRLVINSEGGNYYEIFIDGKNKENVGFEKKDIPEIILKLEEFLLLEI